MQRLVSVQDMTQHLSHYINNVEHGMEIILTRKGKPIVKMVPLEGPLTKKREAHKRLMLLMEKGITLTGDPHSFTRDELHER